MGLLMRWCIIMGYR